MLSKRTAESRLNGGSVNVLGPAEEGGERLPNGWEGLNVELERVAAEKALGNGNDMSGRDGYG